MDANQLSPEVIKILMETGELDPEEAALAKQMETAEALRNRAIAPQTSKNAFGAIAQGLAGYGAGTMQKEFAGKAKPFNERRIKSRNTLYNAMFPNAAKSTVGPGGGGVQDATNLGMYPDMLDPYAP